MSKADVHEQPLQPFRGLHRDVVEVLQHEQAITTATDSKPVLATVNLATCIGITAYERTARIGALGHYDGRTDLELSLAELFDIMESFVKYTHTQFDVNIITAYPQDNEVDRRIIQQSILARKNMHVNITELISPSTERKSIALDTRTGQVYSYNFFENTFKIRRPSSNPKAELIYKPK